MASATPDLRLPSQPQGITASTKLYCLATEAHVCGQLAQGCSVNVERPRRRRCQSQKLDSDGRRTSPARESVLGFQHKMRLSLPQLSSKSESDGHQAVDKMPLQM